MGSQSGQDMAYGGEVVVAEEQMVPHSCVVDKNWGGYLGSQQSQSQARPCSPGFQCWENKAS